MCDYVLGIDLSGPANFDATVLTAFERSGDRIRLIHAIDGASDEAIWRFVETLPADARVTIGLDSPLSYNPGGGDRPGDRELRRIVVAAGLNPGSVMPPTLNRMIYLTARGMALARGLRQAGCTVPTILEVHPGAAMALRGAPIEAVKRFAGQAEARRVLLTWFEAQGVQGVIRHEPSSHFVASCAAGLAAWKWSIDESAWMQSAKPPVHPFDYCA